MNLGVCTAQARYDYVLGNEENRGERISPRGRSAYYSYGSVDTVRDDNLNQDDASNLIMKEKRTDIHTIRFADPNEGERRKHNQRPYESRPSNEVQRLNLNANSMKRDNDQEELENNDVRKIGLDTRALKNSAEVVAESVLAEADNLYATMSNGKARSVAGTKRESSIAVLQRLPYPDSYVLCDGVKSNWERVVQ